MESRTWSRTQELDSQLSAPSTITQSASGVSKDEKPMVSFPPLIHPGSGKVGSHPWSGRWSGALWAWQREGPKDRPQVGQRLRGAGQAFGTASKAFLSLYRGWGSSILTHGPS